MKWEKYALDDDVPAYDLCRDNNEHTGWSVCKLTKAHVNGVFNDNPVKPKFRPGWYVVQPGQEYPTMFEGDVAAVLIVNLRYDTLKQAQVATAMLNSIHGGYK